MKLFDALAHMASQRPINFKQNVTLDAFLLQVASDPADPRRDMAQRLLDAEELFLPPDTRQLRQLQNPRFTFQQVDLPDGITGRVFDDNSTWITSDSRPEHLDTVYIRSPL